MKSEDGFEFREFPCASGKPDALVIFLHGHGNHPDMFERLPPEIQKRYPNADILMVKGPVPVAASQQHKKDLGVAHVDDLYTWYKNGNKPADTLDLAISHLFNRVPVVDQLNKFADAQLAKRGLKDDGLVLFGFSLGGAVVVQMGTRRPDKCAAVICHSGPVLPIIAPKSTPDTMLLMGTEDRLFYKNTRKIANPTAPPKKNRLKKVFDHALSQISVHYNSSLVRLRKTGADEVKGVLVHGMDHTINEESFLHAVGFIVDHLKKPPVAPPGLPAGP